MDDNRRREASLVTSATSGSAIMGTCMVTVARVVGEGEDGTIKGIKKGQRELGEKGKGGVVQ